MLVAVLGGKRERRLYVTIFVVIGLMGFALEILVRAVARDLVGHAVGSDALKTLSFAGWTSLWMFPIYGVVGVFLGHLNRYDGLVKMPMIVLCVIAGTAIAALEFTTGCILNLWWGLAIWSYENRACNLLGQICLFNSVAFALVLVPFGFWVDDWIRWYAHGERKPQKLRWYYCYWKSRAEHPPRS